jgi:hypothetical protein
MITGDPGTAKSIALRLLAHRLRMLSDLGVGTIGHPQPLTSDFYRELGDLFGVPLALHNRFAGSRPPARRALRVPRTRARGRRQSVADDQRAARHARRADLGNYRILMNMADELLQTAVERELARLDEKRFLDVLKQRRAPPRRPRPPRGSGDDSRPHAGRHRSPGRLGVRCACRARCRRGSRGERTACPRVHNVASISGGKPRGRSAAGDAGGHSVGSVHVG